MLLSYIDSLNDHDTIRYNSELNGETVVIPEEVRLMKSKLVIELRAMEKKLNIMIDFRGFEWLQNLLKVELAHKKVIRKSSLGVVNSRKRGSLLFMAPHYKPSIPIHIAIKNCYGKGSKTIDQELESLVLKIFTDRYFASREFARNTQEISWLQGELEPVENLQIHARLYRRNAVALELAPYIVI